MLLPLSQAATGLESGDHVIRVVKLTH